MGERCGNPFCFPFCFCLHCKLLWNIQLTLLDSPSVAFMRNLYSKLISNLFQHKELILAQWAWWNTYQVNGTFWVWFTKPFSQFIKFCKSNLTLHWFLVNAKPQFSYIISKDASRLRTESLFSLVFTHFYFLSLILISKNEKSDIYCN